MVNRSEGRYVPAAFLSHSGHGGFVQEDPMLNAANPCSSGSGCGVSAVRIGEYVPAASSGFVEVPGSEVWCPGVAETGGW
jgi:hypothetical protein